MSLSAPRTNIRRHFPDEGRAWFCDFFYVSEENLLGQLHEGAYFRGKHLASRGRKPFFHQAVDASCHLMERAVVEEMPTFRPCIIPHGLGNQGSDELLEHRLTSLLIFSTLKEKVMRPEQDGGEVKVCCILGRLARAMQGPTLICEK
jgi:hypothetical protein